MVFVGTGRRNNSLTNKTQVLDCLYEVNLQTRKCKAIYWNGIINKKNLIYDNLIIKIILLS